MIDAPPDKLKEMERAVYEEGRRSNTMTSRLLELLAYESAYFQRTINKRGIDQRDADFARGQLSILKKLAQRLKGELNHDN